MAVAQWHPGKLVLFWVLCALGAIAAIGVADSVSIAAAGERQARTEWDRTDQRIALLFRVPVDSARSIVARFQHDSLVQSRASTLTGSQRESMEYLVRLVTNHPVIRPPLTSWYVEMLSIAGALLLFLWPFAVTWRWFSAREERGRSRAAA
jgi:hypothetical protein